jgi:hypothetical protein
MRQWSTPGRRRDVRSTWSSIAREHAGPRPGSVASERRDRGEKRTGCPLGHMSRSGQSPSSGEVRPQPVLVVRRFGSHSRCMQCGGELVVGSSRPSMRSAGSVGQQPASVQFRRSALLSVTAHFACSDNWPRLTLCWRECADKHAWEEAP